LPAESLEVENPRVALDSTVSFRGRVLTVIVEENICTKQPLGVEVWVLNKVEHNLVEMLSLKRACVAAHR
jgi:hypothetical protein